MPRKTKEQTELEKEKNKRTTTKKATTAKKKTTAKKSTDKKADTKKDTAKKSTKKTTTTTKKAVAKKDGTKKSTTKKTAASKKTSTKKSTAKKSITKKVSTKKSTAKLKNDVVEYYDLPYRYNQTVVKLLAQTPTTLFIYWDISDKDRRTFQEQFGDNFFEQTRPVLIVTNNTLGYSFEVEINDFANSWYLHVNDSKCDYKVELGRRPIIKTEKLNVDYIYISDSNDIEAPNDKILFNKNQKLVHFRNVKTGVETMKQINNIEFIRNMGKFYDISENISINNMNILANPSSGSVYKY